MMGKSPTVLKIAMQTNQINSLLRPAFHRAIIFQTKSQKIISIIMGISFGSMSGYWH